MKILKAFCLTFSVYSKIPMPRVYRNKDNMRYALCFLPLVGAAIGGVLMLWYTICLRLNINNACFAALAAAIPVFMTGGIHAGGFISASEALHVRGNKQKRIETLNAPYAGKFGIICAVMYYILYFGFMNEVTIYGEIAMIGLGCIMSRALCAMEIALMKTAKNTGMLYELSFAANKAAVIIVTIFSLAACGLVMILLSAYIGGAVLFCLAVLVAYYKFFAAKKIGGITNDTCGWFIQMSELITVMVIVIGGRLAL